MIRNILRNCVLAGVAITSMSSAIAQEVPQTPRPSSPVMVERAGYVRLEVELTTSASDKIINFNTGCPKRNLWGIDLKELLSGSKHITLGVSITPIGKDALVFTPLSIDKNVSGVLGSNKSCDVMLDQMRYLSPAYNVRTYEGQQFTVAPTYREVTGVNPGLPATIDAGLSLAMRLASVPAATAAPYHDQVKAFLNQVAVSNNEKLPLHPKIVVGPVPPDSAFTWKTTGLFKPKDGAPALDVILVARLVPLATLIPNPSAGADGKIKWSVADVLSSPFAANLSPGFNPPGTMGGYLVATVGTNISNYRNATTVAAASNACDPILSQVQAMGLSDRDQALVMWAVTHNQAPAAVDPYDIDNLSCLQDTWRFAPAEIIGTRDTARADPKPVPTPGVPATVRQMQATTQIGDAFAIFFKSGLWAERRKLGASLFKYPAQYSDAGGLLFDSSSTLDNVDQWLALHVGATPIADRVGCYTYIAAADPTGRSVMYAVADMTAGHSATQALLIATFANVAGNDDARIESVEVTTTLDADRKAKILAANGSQCASGYRPALVFGG